MKGVKVNSFVNGYVGGKEAAGTTQKIINEIRPFDLLMIPFLGHCSVSRNIDLQSSRVIGIDMNPNVINSWKEMEFDWISLHEGSGWEIVSKLLITESSTKKICIYCDPPYRMESIKSNHAPYAFTMSDKDHLHFLAAVDKWSQLPNVDVLISHYPDELYQLKLESWRMIKFTSQTRKGMAEENLFMNYFHENGKLQDYRWVGKDKHERYNLKHRIAKNLINKLNRLEPRKRQALIHYLKKELLDL